MEELLKAINAYIEKTAIAAAEARFSELVANKMMGVDGDDDTLKEKMVELVENDSELANSIDKIVKASVESHVEDLDYSPGINKYFRNANVSISVD